MSYDSSTTTSSRPTLTPEQRRSLRRSAATVAARTREFLPGEYAVGTELASQQGGVRAFVAVRPPVGNPVSAGFAPDFDEEPLLDDEQRDEVARGLAASAALQVKQAVTAGGGRPAAR